ncbi:uncharacterized protein BDCG_17377 [Blastomyces dermatitidis ER-3]|uniref:Uncharacterized protein n=1 Tax=Ajellomyces dermatitidis (strain ER-3 / ATCC MYA-2586) TaxID=559297 RepID=A0ABX2VY56_AJEDR|nr:uncharacterized protein BDCG_17377 [Blastomyces dermatitidis ER-3]OAT02083.1 hypothetical protein BDCG_17377 [Blastomyces dermatitidis ER-3]
MNLQDDICTHYHTVDLRQLSDKSFLFSQENNLDLSDLDSDLPVLSQVEEILISHMHVFIELSENEDVSDQIPFHELDKQELTVIENENYLNLDNLNISPEYSDVSDLLISQFKVEQLHYELEISQ